MMTPVDTKVAGVIVVRAQYVFVSVSIVTAKSAVAVENNRLVDRLRYDAYHDRLTTLPNRRRITDALAESVKVRAPGEVIAVLLFDVD